MSSCHPFIVMAAAARTSADLNLARVREGREAAMALNTRAGVGVSEMKQTALKQIDWLIAS